MIPQSSQFPIESASDILALVGDGVIMANERGVILAFNRAAEEIFGYSADEMLGRPVERLIPERLRANHPEYVAKFGATPDARSRLMGRRREVLGLRKSGEEFPVEATLSHHQFRKQTILTVVIRDITERKRLQKEIDKRNHALIAGDKRLRLALKGGRMGTWEQDIGSDAVRADYLAWQLWGVPPTKVKNLESVYAMVHLEDLPGLKAAVARSAETREDFDHERRIVHVDGKVRWVRSKGTFIDSAHATADTMFGVVFDVTEKRELEEQRSLLTHELNHRMKNVMAVVGSIVALSARSADSVAHYKQLVEGRVGALGRAHAMLVESGWSSATLREQLLYELHPFQNSEGTNILVEGPDVALSPTIGITLGLAIHELATNAVKYGALSVPSGCVAVRWSLDQAPQKPRLVVEWTESGGPPVSPPTRRGFGTILIERLVSQSGEVVKIDYNPAGVFCRIVVPLAE